MRLLFFGTPDFAVPALDALLRAGHDVACVVTQPDRPSGRHRRPGPPPVKDFAAAHGLPICQPERVNARAFVDGAAALAPEAIIVAAFGQRLGRRLLAIPRRGCLNIHPSLLPRYRGAAPVPHAILTGDRETGVTIMLMAPEMDAGDILAQAATPIGPRETAGDLNARLARLGPDLLVRALDDLAAGTARPVPQDHAKATRAPALSKADGIIGWTHPADYLDRFVRAMSPWPGAYTFWTPPCGPPLRLVIVEAEPAAGEAAQPGRVAATDGPIAVETGSGRLAVRRLQPAGKRVMTAADFLRGHELAVGERLGWVESTPSETEDSRQ